MLLCWYQDQQLDSPVLGATTLRTVVGNRSRFTIPLDKDPAWVNAVGTPFALEKSQTDSKERSPREPAPPPIERRRGPPADALGSHNGGTITPARSASVEGGVPGRIDGTGKESHIDSRGGIMKTLSFSGPCKFIRFRVHESSSLPSLPRPFSRIFLNIRNRLEKMEIHFPLDKCFRDTYRCLISI